LCARNWSCICSVPGGTCDGYNWLEVNVAIDAAQLWYYDAVTGQLVAIVQWGPDSVGQRCLAGPGEFAVASSCPAHESTAVEIVCDAGPADVRGE
jgi:hypothetical protein